MSDPSVDGPAPRDVDITRRWLIRTSVAVVVSLGLFALATYLLLGSDDDDSEIIGAARLTWDADTDDPLGEGKAASVEVIRDDDRHRVFVFDLEVLRTPADEEFIETWLVTVDGEEEAGRLSVGRIDEIRTRLFEVPAGVDPLDFTRVEFSLERDDGDPAPSGRTLLAGDIVWLVDPDDGV